MKNKYFIITIDTEADNQWDVNHICTTENAKYLPRFQELAEKYEFKPVWLTTYEMANDSFFVKYFKEKQDKGLCEIGMHLHAWNNPPEYELECKTNERPYLIEYPVNIMEKKIKNLDLLLTKKFQLKPVSHRAGRWTMNDDYFSLLIKYGYKIDCSITPHISWKKKLGYSGLRGADYRKFGELPFFWNDKLLETPMTIKKIHLFKKRKNVLKKFKSLSKYIIGKNQWVRPDKDLDKKGIVKVINKCNKKNEYIMFMIHSSELMPNGSPNFETVDKIEKLYILIEEIFKYSKQLGYKGITLRNYYNLYEEEIKSENH